MGMGLLAFRNTFTWARHALFAVLSGCTTIVQGCDREKVLQTVRALALFVPGCPGTTPRSEVLSWHDTGPLTYQDIGRYAIIGAPSELKVHPALSRLCATMDVDEGVLVAPVYHGLVLDQLLYGTNRTWKSSNVKNWTDENMFLAHVQSVLMEIASRASLHHQHACGLSPAKVTPGPGQPIYFEGTNKLAPSEVQEFILELKALRDLDAHDFHDVSVAPLKHNSNAGRDVEIYEYLAEVVREQLLHFSCRPLDPKQKAQPLSGTQSVLLRGLRSPCVRMTNHSKRGKVEAVQGEKGESEWNV